ncbi:HpcH/HpaI aldolase/citrate lyase family protein [Pelosinus sp. sgz500959]|uniref:HpcH/HpaI aldolase family protein n=1 Tax=Pelosinus sp. sgz500959 TaxID=3242472 RepID=UPI00366A6A34
MSNNLKVRLKNGENIMGTMITVFDSPEIAKILKVCGFDYFIIDCEHGAYNYSSVATILAVAREAGIPGIVRIPEIKREVVLKYMEMGAAGLLLPNTETAEQAQLLVEYSKYAPLGNRGVSLLRPHTGFENVGNAVEYMKKANKETVLMVQIESLKGVENVGKMLDIEGIDAAFMGPNDLSQSMGILGQFDHPDFIAAIDHVILSAKQRGKYSGTHLTSADAILSWMDKGMSLNLWSNDVVHLMNGAKAGLAKLKK